MKKIASLVKIFCLLILSLSCGKETQIEKKQERSIAPSTQEIYFNALKNINHSIETNNIEKLKWSISEAPYIDLNQILSNGDTFLIMAIRKDFRQIRNFLIYKDANPQKANVNGETPIMIAVKNNYLNSVKVLLDLKVDIEKKNLEGDAPLHVAIKNKFDDVALELLKYGANIKSTDKNDQSSIQLIQNDEMPLSFEFIKNIESIEYGVPDISSFRKILEQGEVNLLSETLTRFPKIAKEYETINPLAILVDVKNESLGLRSAQMLLNHEANINGPMEAEVTPLIKATIQKKKNFANFYLQSNANPQLLDQEGKSALIHAIEQNNSELVDLLLSYSAVEKYTFRKNGQKLTFDACEVASGVSKKLKNQTEKKLNEKIQKSLYCGFLSWFF